MRLRDALLLILGIVVGVVATLATGMSANEPVFEPVSSTAAEPAPSFQLATEHPAPRIESAQAEVGGPLVRPADPVDEEGEPLVLYREDGPQPCDQACVDRLTDRFLRETYTDEEIGDIASIMSAVATRIGSDPSLKRRYLASLGQVRLSSDDEDSGAFRTMLLYHLGEHPDFAKEASSRLASSPDPETRQMALTVLFHADPTSPETAARIEDAIARESSAPSLGHALDLLAGLPGERRPGTMAAVRDLALAHDDPDVRRAAIRAFAWSEADQPVQRDRVLQHALRDAEPKVRLAAVQGLSETASGQPSEARLAEYRQVASDIANDVGADPQVRMEALGLLAYTLSTERAARTWVDVQ